MLLAQTCRRIDAVVVVAVVVMQLACILVVKACERREVLRRTQWR